MGNLTCCNISKDLLALANDKGVPFLRNIGTLNYLLHNTLEHQNHHWWLIISMSKYHLLSELLHISQYVCNTNQSVGTSQILKYISKNIKKFTYILCIYELDMEFYHVSYFATTTRQVSFKAMSTCNFSYVFLSPAIMHHIPCSLSLPWMLPLHGLEMICQGLDGTYATNLKMYTTSACKYTCVIIKANCKAMLWRTRYTQHNYNSNLQVWHVQSNYSQNTNWKSN